MGDFESECSLAALVSSPRLLDRRAWSAAIEQRAPIIGRVVSRIAEKDCPRHPDLGAMLGAQATRRSGLTVRDSLKEVARKLALSIVGQWHTDRRRRRIEDSSMPTALSIRDAARLDREHSSYRRQRSILREQTLVTNSNLLAFADERRQRRARSQAGSLRVDGWASATAIHWRRDGSVIKASAMPAVSPRQLGLASFRQPIAAGCQFDC